MTTLAAAVALALGPMSQATIAQDAYPNVID